MEQIFMIKENYIYVGIDLHKETHTAVMIDCYNQKLGEITFPNRPADFPKLVAKVKKCNTDGKTIVFGLENAYGYGRALAVWLIDKGYLVKDVNTAISHRQAKHRGAMYRKSDSDDAEAIALATLNMLDKLPDAYPNDAYWSLGQLVHRRDNIMKQRTRLVNQLHEQLCIAYPSYKQFFNDISRPTALYFWEHYPSRKYLKGKSVEDLRAELVPVSHNKCSTRTCEKILDAIAGDKVKNNAYQDARDMVTLSIVSDLQHYDKQLAEVDKMLEQMYKMLGCTLTTIPGVNVITAVKILAEIGDIKRFSNANKLAQFAGIAPLHLSSSGKGKDLATKQGNRRLQATIYFLAIQMVQISSKGTPRNPVVRAYYEKRKAEGKTSQQALICISRRLISIIYGMLKSGTEYRMPVMENTGETV
jgi:transposase